MLSTAERDLFIVHAAVVVLAALLLLPSDVAPGWRVALVVVAYDISLVMLAKVADHKPVWQLWRFAAILSLWQLLPDWFLVEGLGTLTFLRDGFPDIGPVTGYMLGLWTLPVLITTATGLAMEERWGRRTALAGVLGSALVLFVGAEAVAPLIPAWQPQNVHTIGNVALYIVPAELVFSVAAYEAFQQTRRAGIANVTAAALAVATLYTGAAALSWLLFERLLG